MEEKLIYGIQQIGVGVDDAEKAFEWYATRLGSDVPVFDDNNTATYMAPYMGGAPHEKRAILAMNLEGGSGYEIWQYLDRTPVKPESKIQIGDLGINCAFIKSRDIEASFQRIKNLKDKVLTEIITEPDNKRSFYVEDPYGNVLKIKESDVWYANNGKDVGGIYGCSIGVSDIESSLALYSDILGYDQVVYYETSVFKDFDGLPNGNSKFRRVLLTHKNNRIGGLSRLFGPSELELIQCLDKQPKKIFENRYWGDIGFIHLCFDIRNMKALIQECEDKGFPFKVISPDSFDMGDANGHWGYIEDCDGTLIEFVETHKIPVIKPIGLNLNLNKRDPLQPVPNWMIKAMQLKRVKNFRNN